jgi:hypothetical protein
LVGIKGGRGVQSSFSFPERSELFSFSERAAERSLVMTAAAAAVVVGWQ